jgi:glutamate/tyrosine decarboxylase-like PLP-dependent enzyme
MTLRLDKAVRFMSMRMSQHSVPFFSPRYAAYMASEVTLPASVGNLMASLYNPNNLAPQGGPLTTAVEYEVGQQLCRMLGFPVAVSTPSEITSGAWGHITSGGSVANIEALW